MDELNDNKTVQPYPVLQLLVTVSPLTNHVSSYMKHWDRNVCVQIIVGHKMLTLDYGLVAACMQESFHL